MAFILNRQIIGGIVPALLTLSILVEICFAKNVPAIFVFGDSLVDVGNNNYILSLAKANYIPNGIDFGMATGRFTNGRTTEFGVKDYLPPYLAPTTAGSVILQGVNYASAGGGILNYTGKILGDRINMDAQIDNFANSRQDIISNIGAPAALTLLGKAIFFVMMGSNDFINNYLTPVISAAEQKLITPEVFVGTMISRFKLQLTRLYNLGARKIIVVNVGPIGCIPYLRDTNPAAGDNDCVSLANQLAQLFNAELKSLTMDLSANLQESKFAYADFYRIVEDILQNYISYVCSDRSKYVFWDMAHPTEAANFLIARRLIDGDTNDITPINLRQFARL
ncbi:gdsl esterase/lipase [Quercus suber]|uniref:Gdsl esterase/lipase n=1 Tax=Quercus suber TaxID=58331 RepID=A0AAW0KG34_QUESU